LYVGNALYTNAVKHMNPAAQIWWTKSRMRWSDTGNDNANDESAGAHESGDRTVAFRMAKSRA
jgi:hypothetical protein